MEVHRTVLDAAFKENSSCIFVRPIVLGFLSVPAKIIILSKYAILKLLFFWFLCRYYFRTIGEALRFSFCVARVVCVAVIVLQSRNSFRKLYRGLCQSRNSFRQLYERLCQGRNFLRKLYERLFQSRNFLRKLYGRLFQVAILSVNFTDCIVKLAICSVNFTDSIAKSQFVS